MAEETEVYVSTIGNLLVRRGATLAVAESCTGGGLAAAITAVPGSSKYFTHGFVTYSNEAKRDMLGVKEDSLLTHGAVSSEVACEMALGTLDRAKSDYSVAITGIAGPSGPAHDGAGESMKPVGLVWFAFARSSISDERSAEIAGCEVQHFRGSRKEVRSQSVRYALERLLTILSEEKLPGSRSPKDQDREIEVFLS